MALPITPETRTLEQIAADDLFAARMTMTVTPELIVRGQRVPSGQIVEIDGMTFDLRPRAYGRRSFANLPRERTALSNFAELRKQGVSPEKAYRLALSTDTGPDVIVD